MSEYEPILSEFLTKEQLAEELACNPRTLDRCGKRLDKGRHEPTWAGNPLSKIKRAQVACGAGE